uniref:Pre-mRNA processing factor 4 (PRP4)-like domain-containing protein n=1 Tax=Picocystis salinarum TaxID=88271 RepID=A0A7S3XE42_9CHLO
MVDGRNPHDAKWEEQRKTVEEHEWQRKMRQVPVPVHDQTVRMYLRRWKEPVTLFGEEEMERRDRLRRCIAQRERDGNDLPNEWMEPHVAYERDEDETMDVDRADPPEIFYTVGCDDLERTRRKWAVESLRRAKQRIECETDERHRTNKRSARALFEQNARRLVLEHSQAAHRRPVVGCSLSNGGDTVATCIWDGTCRLWDGNDLRGKTTFAAHEERCTDVRIHPSYRAGVDGPCAATGSSDGTAKLWDDHGGNLATYKGHADRLARIAFHPYGHHLATTSFDRTRRLWDVETEVELLLQEGHSRAVYALAFQCDGSWCVSGRLDAVGWVWDLRTGRHIHTLTGHIKPILAVDVAEDGYTVATAGEDHTCRLWDLRQRRCIYTLPAHSSLISAACFETKQGETLLTASFDGTSRLWSTSTYTRLNTLETHNGEVATGAVAAEAALVVSAGFDKSLKRWCADREGEWPNALRCPVLAWVARRGNRTQRF